MVATDRISTFDHILKNDIVDKGAIYTDFEVLSFDLTEDIVPNHLISVDNDDMPEFFRSRVCSSLHYVPAS